MNLSNFKIYTSAILNAFVYDRNDTCLLTLFGMAFAPSFNNSCNYACLDVYEPVCGKEVKPDGITEERTFSNSCYMGLEKDCHGRKFEPCCTSQWSIKTA